MRYRLRTLLILLAVGPPLLAGAWWLCESLQWRLVHTGTDVSGVTWAEAVEAAKRVKPYP